MPTITVRAIVLRAADYKDYDRILTIFALGRGEITASARYCRRLKSPLLNATVPFVAGEFVLQTRGGYYQVSSCSVEEAHYALRADPVRLAVAAFLCSACEEAVQQDLPADGLFRLLLQALAFLCYGGQSPYATALYFFVRMLDDQGIGPVLARCSLCGGELTAPAFDPAGAGALCGLCALSAPNVRRVDPNALREAEAARSGPFTPPDSVSPEAFSLIADYVCAHFERSFKALNFLRRMQI